jgi:hypothetical protein
VQLVKNKTEHDFLGKDISQAALVNNKKTANLLKNKSKSQKSF